MVQASNYVVELVDAKTKRPFREHQDKKGGIYVETSPDDEYFIKLQVIGGDSGKVHKVNYVVDGKDLGYYTSLSLDNGEFFTGLWSFDADTGTSRDQALRFHKAKVVASSTTASSPDSNIDLLGKVVVTFSEAIFEGMEDRESFNALQIEAEPVSSDADPRKKLLRSSAGEHSEVAKGATVTASYRKGKLLETVTIYYTTAQGLVQAGVLAAPPTRVAQTSQRSTRGGNGSIPKAAAIATASNTKQGADDASLADNFYDLTLSGSLSDSENGIKPKPKSKPETFRSKTKSVVIPGVEGLPPRTVDIVEILSSDEEDE